MSGRSTRGKKYSYYEHILKLMLTGFVNRFNVEFERKIRNKDDSTVFVITAQLFFERKNGRNCI